MKTNIRFLNGRTFLEMEGKRIHSPAYTYLAERGDPKHPKQVVEQGLRVVFSALDTLDTAWKLDGSFDTHVLNKALNTFADSSADLGIIVRFTIDTPGDFAAQHPEELVRFAHVPDDQMTHDEYKGGLLHVLPKFASFASKVWHKAGCRYVDAVMDFVERHPQGHRVIGYMINTGETAEALLWGCQEGLYGDFSDPGIRAFRQWLTRRYGDEAGFQRAYRNPEFSLEKIMPPSLEERASASFGELRDPQKDLLLIDYDRFQSDLVVDALLHWHRYARQRLGAGKLLGCFYGYCLWNSGMLNVTPAQGHCALTRLLKAPELDFVTGITTYWKRALSQPGNYMLPVASVALHGKLHWNEDDLRTHVVLSNENVWATPAGGVPVNEAGSVNIYRRQFCRALTDGSQTWYFDIAGGQTNGTPKVGGMYDSPGILKEFERQCEIANRLADTDLSSCAEVACIVSELTPLYHRQYPGSLHQHRDTVADLLCDRVTEGLYRTGVPLDWYLSSDLGKADFSQYKVIYFFNQVVATAAERAAIERLKTQGRILIFLWSPGFLTETEAGARLSSELTGIRMQETPLRGPARVAITDFNTPLTRELATVRSIGTDMVYAPLLAIDDPAATVFGRYDWNQAPAAAVREFRDWTSVVLGTCTSEPELLRAILRNAGCTIRCETGDVIMENRSVLGLHAWHGGPQVLRLPPGCRGLQDLYSGNRFMVSDGFVHVGVVGRGATRMFLKLNLKS